MVWVGAGVPVGFSYCMGERLDGVALLASEMQRGRGPRRTVGSGS